MKKAKLFCASWVSLFLLAACSTINPENAPGWKDEDIAGLHIKLEDPLQSEQFHFRADGFVSATYGSKDGPLTAPLLKWKISDGVLEIGEEYSTRWVLISRSSKMIVIKDFAGRFRTYRILNSK